MDSRFLQILEKTREYLDYLEEHYKNVQWAFSEFKTALLSYKENRETRIIPEADSLCEILFYSVESGKSVMDCLERQVQNHDLSKFDEKEFTIYRKNFFPVDEKEKEDNLLDFESAWDHHQKNNAHHYQHRTTEEYKEKKKIRKLLDCIENVLDWMAMGKKFNQEIDEYYLEKKDEMDLSEQDKTTIETIFKVVKGE